MDTKKYSLGLSSFPLISNELITAAGVYLEHRDWSVSKNRIIVENLLQRTRLSTRKVATNETLKRLKHAHIWEMEMLEQAHDSQDRNFICLLLVSRQYKLFMDFVSEFLIYKITGGDYELHTNEIINWYETLGETHEEIANMKPGSFKRLVNHTKSILADGGLLQVYGENFKIIQPGISFQLRSKYENEGTLDDLQMLLKTDKEIEIILERRK